MGASDQCHELTKRPEYLLELEEDFWRARSRTSLLAEGDRNTLISITGQTNKNIKKICCRVSLMYRDAGLRMWLKWKISFLLTLVPYLKVISCM